MPDAGRLDRRRKPTLRLRPEIRYQIRWEPELDGCTGLGGHGLIDGLRAWWQLRRGTWKDDWDPCMDWDPGTLADARPVEEADSSPINPNSPFGI